MEGQFTLPARSGDVHAHIRVFVFFSFHPLSVTHIQRKETPFCVLGSHYFVVMKRGLGFFSCFLWCPQIFLPLW